MSTPERSPLSPHSPATLIPPPQGVQDCCFGHHPSAGGTARSLRPLQDTLCAHTCPCTPCYTLNMPYTYHSLTYPCVLCVPSGQLGGFQDTLRAPADFVYAIPDAIDSVSAAPLLCAGVTVFAPLRRCGSVSLRVPGCTDKTAHCLGIEDLEVCSSRELCHMATDYSLTVVCMYDFCASGNTLVRLRWQVFRQCIGHASSPFSSVALHVGSCECMHGLHISVSD